MGTANTKLSDDLWNGSGSMTRYQSSETSTQRKQTSTSGKGDSRPHHEKGDGPAPNSDVGDEVLDPYDPLTAGPIFPNGEINWDCPCLGGAAHGPCGTEFRDAFSCFHHSKEEIKGSDCFPQFREMSSCFAKYPELYGSKDEDDDENEIEQVKGVEEDVEFNQDELDLINEESSNESKRKKVVKDEEPIEQEKKEEKKEEQKKETKEPSHPETKTKLPDVKRLLPSPPAVTL